MQILDEIVLYQKGCFRKVRRYLRGANPARGVIVRGFTGWETVEEVSEIIPVGVFDVDNIQIDSGSVRS